MARMDTPYDITDRRVEYAQAEPRALRVGWWRGVAPNNTIFACESMMDELAKKAGKDPDRLPPGASEQKPALEKGAGEVAQKSGWGTHFPPGRGAASAPSSLSAPIWPPWRKSKWTRMAASVSSA